MTNQVPVRVSRQGDAPLGGDLFGWIDVVWDAVAREYEAFGASDVWDVWPMEVHLDHVIVQDMNRGRYYRADLSVNEEKESVEFTNVQRVTHSWVPMGEGQVERDEAPSEPDLQTVLVKRGKPRSLFQGLI